MDKNEITRSIEVIPAREGFNGKNIPTKINWGAIGSVTIEETEVFIQGLQDAVKLAKGGY